MADAEAAARAAPPARARLVGFARAKAAAMSKLAQARAAGEADEGALAAIDAVNRREDAFTTSSCAGRIALMEVPDEDAKLGARFVGKWHRPVETEEVLALLDPPPAGPVWLFVQGAILHVTCRDLEAAKRLLGLALASGHKSSAVKALGRHPVVEVRSTEVMALPVARGGALLVPGSYVRAVVAEADRRMASAARRLARLARALGSPAAGAPPGRSGARGRRARRQVRSEAFA